MSGPLSSTANVSQEWINANLGQRTVANCNGNDTWGGFEAMTFVPIGRLLRTRDEWMARSYETCHHAHHDSFMAYALLVRDECRRRPYPSEVKP